MTAQRTKDWNEFAAKVADHIENYTVPQYGDAPNDNVESWSSQDCIAQIQKYAARFGTNQRAGQEELDLMKIAHYAQLAMCKLQQKPFCDAVAIEHLLAGKPVCWAGNTNMVVISIINGNALSRFINTNYGTGDDEVNLPIDNQYLVAYADSGVEFSPSLPTALHGWVLASDGEVRAVLSHGSKQSGVWDAAR